MTEDEQIDALLSIKAKLTNANLTSEEWVTLIEEAYLLTEPQRKKLNDK